ncbi:thiol reductant ABC exporter subunit CydC [Arthrobacter psychrolactophilus]|uniref:Thiol reductant ABC exporter subunit CydC n=1 Tax=Arthrobacter psychrolactophilus TaxID=92442 RepID=A0A2V5J6M7_9MICC|nr:thiol reductant ABC exporter subunit CydC [Arthrobacter psychrolactophilus]PYI38340.1 thiol reductant ABC exporter subunit CydC [Arthrobacter psychrolactophilus]
MSPRPALPEGKSTRLALAGLAGLSALKAVALVLLMGALAHALGQWAAGDELNATQLIVQGSVGSGLLGLTVWGQSVLARRAALGTKEELRAKLVAHRLNPRSGGSSHGGETRGGVGAESMLASRGLDGLDNYFSNYLPALVSCAVLPLLVGVQILIADWVSALIVVLTVPLVPVFMILIGFHTQERVEAAASGLDRLSNHLLELARGLPVLVGLRRAAAQRKALADVCESYRVSTMATLRTAFLSSMALELISTISVAVVAVFIGVRLVSGDMGLEAGLLALMLAPECFRPLRDVGAAHHGSEDGVEALRRVKEILGEETTPATQKDEALAAVTNGNAVQGELVLRIENLSVSYPGRGAAVVDGYSAELAPGEALVLATPSGSGKSTILAAIAGTLDGGATERETVSITGSLQRRTPGAQVFVAQHPVFTEETVLAELALYAAGPQTRPVETALLISALKDVNAAHLAQRTVVDCSPGELRRVAVARALARIAADPAIELGLFDEPTAHLDPMSATAVRGALLKLRGSVALIVATHDHVLAALLNGTVPATAGALAATGPQDLLATASDAPSPWEELPEVAVPKLSWRHVRALPLRSPRFALGVLLSALATLSAAALSGISGWLIVWAADQPPILYLMTLIVGVRAFGIGRSILRYCERLMTHDAVFRWAAQLRLRLWDSLGSSVLHWGKLSRSGGALGSLVADVDELRDAVPRAVVPLPAAILSYGAVLLTVFLMVPEVTWIVLALGVLALVVLPIVVLAAQRRASAAAALHRVWLAGRITTLFAAAQQLSANGVGRAEAQRFRTQDAAVAKPLRRLAWADGLGQGAVTLLTSVAAIAVAATAIAAGADPRAAAVVALLMLALAEPLGQFVEAVSALPALAAMMRRTLPLLDAPTTVLSAPENLGTSDAVTELAVESITARYPTTANPVLSNVSGGTRRGQWWTVSGPSGSGKSTLLAVLLGFLPSERGRYLLNGQPATAQALEHIAWCPQDSYLFNSTLRGNLAIAKPAHQPPTEAALRQALTTVGLGPWLESLPQGLDTRVGPGGHHLSGGQRTRVSVARTLVAGADVVLLDEPTAHLGEDEAEQLIVDLRAALTQAAVVLVTHDDELAHSGDTHLRLGETGVEVATARL